ncbi:hypothetical protein SNEBB_004055 [Seison nebaliae]|nr:hypothetical protein SNEBB_004055 [Seison nebaliae]
MLLSLIILSLCTLEGIVGVKNVIKFQSYYNNWRNDKCGDWYISLVAVRCLKMVDCLGFKLELINNHSIDVSYLMSYENCNKKFFDRQNSQDVVIYLLNNIESKSKAFVKSENGKILQKYETITLPEEASNSPLFISMKHPLNYSFVQYQHGFYENNYKYFGGLIKLSELSKKYSNLTFVIRFLTDTEEDNEQVYTFAHSSPITCETNYKLDPIIIHSHNLIDKHISKMQTSFGAYDTNELAKKYGFGFWFKEPALLYAIGNNFFHNKSDTEVIPMTHVIVTVNDASLDDYYD